MIRRPDSIAARALLTAALLAASAFVTGASTVRAAARPDILPVADVRAGMVGLGYTVFQGTKVDTFSLSILGVLRAYRPGGSLILARPMNPYLEKTGIIAGMSGSPVYVGGRLIGAVSYTWGFLKEPLAAITPIEEMLDVLPGSKGRPENRDDLRFGSRDGPATDADRAGVAGDRWARAEGLPSGFDTAALRPIATPVSLSGFTDEAMRFLEPWFRERGMVAVPGGAPTGALSCDSLVAGSSVGVQLVRGDWNAAAIGTVTYRDGDRVLGFGHPFTSMGWVDFPMTGAEITTVMVSSQVSNKVGSATDACGTLVADRVAGVAGEVGAVPAMIPVRVAIKGSGGREHRFRFEVVRSRLLTPGLVSGVAVSSISSALNDVGLCTIRYSFTTYWNGGSKIGTRSDAVLSSAPVSGVGEEIAQSLTLLLGEHFRPSRLDSAEVVVDVEEGLDVMMLTGIRPSSLEVAPGDSIHIEASFRRPGHGTEIRRTAIRVPPSAAEGSLTLRVCDGDETNRWEQARAPQLYQPETLDDLLAIYAGQRRADRLYVQLYAETPGVALGGGEVPQAPRSVLSVLGVGSSKTDEKGLKGATVSEREYDFGHVVRGCETVTITVSADHRR